MSASPEASGIATLRSDAAQSRIPALTGMRAIATLLVIGTHAAFATGKLTHGYLGAIYARLEVGVAVFFVLSGFLLFRPLAAAAASGGPLPDTARYFRHRVRRIAPAYLVVVLATFELYVVFTPGPNPAQTWHGLLRYLTLTQIYTDDYLVTYLHPGLSQMWSLAVEASFYAALPALAYVLLRMRAGWRPGRTLADLALLGAIAPGWLLIAASGVLPNSAGMWLPAHLGCFAGGMALAVLHIRGARWRARTALASAAALFLVVATPVGGAIIGPDPVWVPAAKSLLYAAIATLAVGALVLGDWPRYGRILSSRPMTWLGQISYEIFLLHVVVMAVTMHVVLRWQLFTGSLLGLYLATLMVTVPLAWALHAVTRPRSAGNSSVNARPRCDAASFSSGVSSAAERAEPCGTKTGS